MNETVFFDGSGSYDSDGSIVSYYWDFGDGDNGSGINVTHTYTTRVNYYLLLLTVHDNQGLTGSATLKVRPRNLQPENVDQISTEGLMGILENLSTENSLEFLLSLNTTYAIDIIQRLTNASVTNLVYMALDIDLESNFTDIFLETDAGFAAQVISSMTDDTFLEFSRLLINANLSKTVAIFEEAILQDYLLKQNAILKVLLCAYQ